MILLQQAIDASVKNEEDDSVLKGFVEVAETAPKVMKPHIQESINLMLLVSPNFIPYSFPGLISYNWFVLA